MDKRETGFVHGRFQVFHLEHLEYVMLAARQSSFLWVGVTQPEIESLREVAGAEAHRHLPVANPMAYWERALIIHRILLTNGFSDSDFSITPFPIERPTTLANYIPIQSVAYNAICDKWGIAKAALLRDAGYKVVNILQRPVKRYSGTEIRRLICAGSDDWKQMVPPGCADALHELGIIKRLTGESI
jgi:nicotinamide mononucleotide adenylyltransferase